MSFMNKLIKRYEKIRKSLSFEKLIEFELAIRNWLIIIIIIIIIIIEFIRNEKNRLREIFL
jgi:hypothetical protein